MLSNKRYQVFVSSTQADLRDEREAIINSLTKIGYIAVGMEQFPATDEEQMDYIRPVIDESDYYVVVIKGRYGSVGADGISYTEKEFRYAVESGKPALAFLYKDVGSLRLSDTDRDPEKMRKLNEFRAELELKRIVKYWLSVEELVASVKDSVNDQVRRRPAVGWIRGNQALDPEVYRERDELRKEVENLRRRLLEFSEAEGLAQGKDLINLKFKVTFRRRSSQERFKDVMSFEDDETRPTVMKTLSISCDELFDLLRVHLYQGDAESTFAIVLENWYKNEYEKNNKTDKVRINLEYKLIESLRFHFEALGLINAELPDNVYGSAPQLCWRLTDKGRARIATMHAFKREEMTKSTP